MLESKELILIIVTSLIGSIVRITREWNGHTITLSKAVFILFCSATIGYLIQGSIFYLKTNGDLNLTNYIGHFCIIGGVISLEIVNLFIEQIPNVIKKLISKKLSINLNEKDESETN